MTPDCGVWPSSVASDEALSDLRPKPLIWNELRAISPFLKGNDPGNSSPYLLGGMVENDYLKATAGGFCDVGHG